MSPVFFNEDAKPQNSKRIIFIGDTDTRKQLGVLIQAFGEAKNKGAGNDWKVIVFGPVIRCEYFNKINRVICDYGLSDDVIFRGIQYPEVLAKEMAAAAMVALCSIQETAPMCISEGMAVGLPVIATKVGGVGSMIREEQDGLLSESNDMAGFAKNLLTMMNNSDLRAQYGAAGKSTAIKRWSPDVIAKKTVAVYKTVHQGNLHK